ncbi:hypothetical protein Pla123a_03800 [Posidoniimonas polymericola]|uniref:Uncharacterized protein n=1 Tax=Posidoniimonas polymericola TaxID=2528002 RepID=A0A5C5ZG83_9BACT|nr:hypothetical protein Pla123a_03800 [Posidoniimonas polymericola]
MGGEAGALLLGELGVLAARSLPALTFLAARKNFSISL